MKKLAHRGYSYLYPENTMLAFQKAIERGFDGIETDVHLTKDGYLVLCHDETIDRTSNGKGYIKDLTLDELKQYSFSCHSQYNEKIPLLKDLLLLIKDKDILLNIELKTDVIHYQGIEKKVYDLVDQIGVQKQIIYSSFYLPSLLTLKEIDKNICVGYLYSSSQKKKLEQTMNNHIYQIHPKYTLVNPKIMEYYYKHHLKVVVWTVPTLKKYEYFKKLGVDFIISNDFFED